MYAYYGSRLFQLQQGCTHHQSKDETDTKQTLLCFRVGRIDNKHVRIWNSKNRNTRRRDGIGDGDSVGGGEFCPLKVNGWKMTFPFGARPKADFQPALEGVSFREVFFWCFLSEIGSTCLPLESIVVEMVPLKGGRWHIILQLAVYTTYIPPIYCLLGGYMLPTTFQGNQKQPLIEGLFFCEWWAEILLMVQKSC